MPLKVPGQLFFLGKCPQTETMQNAEDWEITRCCNRCRKQGEFYSVYDFIQAKNECSKKAAIKHFEVLQDKSPLVRNWTWQVNFNHLKTPGMTREGLKRVEHLLSFKRQKRRNKPIIDRHAARENVNQNATMNQSSSEHDRRSLRRKREKDVSDRLAIVENGRREVRIPKGIVDVVTETEAIEVKGYRLWRGALGQAHSYAKQLNKSARMHLYANSRSEWNDLEETKPLIEESASDINVRVTYELCPPDTE